MAFPFFHSNSPNAHPHESEGHTLIFHLLFIQSHFHFLVFFPDFLAAMGAFLDKPETEKTTSTGTTSDGMPYAMSCMQGWRMHMEVRQRRLTD